MEVCEIIVWTGGTFKSSHVFIGEDKDKVALRAEKCFKETVRSLIDYYDVQDECLDADLENGYFYDTGEDIEVIITWPEITEVK